MAKKFKATKANIATVANVVTAIRSQEACLWTLVDHGIKLGRILKRVKADCTVNGKLDEKAFDDALVALKLRAPKLEQDKRSTRERERQWKAADGNWYGMSADNRSLCIQLADAGKPAIQRAYDRKVKANPSYKASSVSGMIKLIKTTDPKIKAANKNKPPMAIDQAISNYFAFARKHHGMTSTQAVDAITKYFDNLPGAIVDADAELEKQRKAS